MSVEGPAKQDKLPSKNWLKGLPQFMVEEPYFRRILAREWHWTQRFFFTGGLSSVWQYDDENMTEIAKKMEKFILQIYIFVIFFCMIIQLSFYLFNYKTSKSSNTIKSF